MKNYHNTKFLLRSLPLALIFLGVFGNSMLSVGQVLPPPGNIPPPPSAIPSFPEGIPAPPSVVPPGVPSLPSIPPPAPVPPSTPPSTPVPAASLPVSPAEAIPAEAGFLGSGKFGDPVELIGIEGLDEPLDRIKLRDMPGKDALEMLQLWTGRYILRPQNLPQVQLNFDSFSVLTKREALMAIESLLTMNGIALTKIDNLFWKAIPALGVNAQVPIWLDGPASAIKPSQRIYIKMIHLKYAPAFEVREQLNAFATPNVSSLIVFDHANSILITDSLLNLQRMEKLVDQIDHPVRAVDLGIVFETYHTRRADPHNLRDILDKTFAAEAKVGGLKSMLRRTPGLTSDARTGTLMIRCHKDDLKLIMDYIKVLDGEDKVIEIKAKSKLFTLQYASVGGSSSGGQTTSKVKSRGVLPIIEDIIKKREEAIKKALEREQAQNSGGKGATPKAVSGKGVPPVPGKAQQGNSSNALSPGTGSRDNPEFSDFLAVLGDDRTNSILVYGTEQDIDQIGSIIELLDKPLPMAQIDTIFVMVDITASGSRGIDLFSGALRYNSNEAIASTTQPGPDGGTTDEVPAFKGIAGAINPPGFGGPLTFVMNDSKLSELAWDNIFKIAQTNSDTRIFSSPSIVLSHFADDVEISMKNEKTIFTDNTSTNTTTGSSFQNSPRNDFKSETTLILEEPRISLPKIQEDGRFSKGSVFTKVRLITSKMDEGGSGTYNGQSVPSTQTREVTTQLSFKDGEIVALGGLQQISTTRTENQYAMLRKIPLLGKTLFSPKTETYEPTELLIFMRARIFSEETGNNFIQPSKMDEMFQKDYVPRFESPVSGDSPKSNFLKLGNIISSDKSSSQDQPSILPRL